MSKGRIYTGMGHPSIAHLSWKDRARLTRAAWTRVVPQRGDWLWERAAAVSFMVFFVGLIGLVFVSSNRTGSLFCALMAMLVFMWAPCEIRNFLARRRRFMAELQKQLMEEDIRPAVCFVCGYDLRGCDSVRCAECGTRLRKETLNHRPAAT